VARRKAIPYGHTIHAKLCAQRPGIRAATTSPRPDSRVPRGLGRLGARWHGLVHLRAGDGARAARTTSALRPHRPNRQHRILWRLAVCPVPDRVGTRISLGTRRRQVWPRANTDGDDLVVLGVHAGQRRRDARMATRAPAPACGNWHRRRVGHRRHVRRRSVARKAAGSGWRDHAHRLTISGFCWRDWQTRGLGAATAGAPCSLWEERLRCWWR